MPQKALPISHPPQIDSKMARRLQKCSEEDLKCRDNLLKCRDLPRDGQT
jgi:hypothetical protein